VLDLWHPALVDCDGPDDPRRPLLAAALEARRGGLPLWHGGRALFASFGRAVAVAGDWNGWDAEALLTRRLCGTDVFVAVDEVASGHHPYKVVEGDQWRLDPESPAFAYDDFPGNVDGRNSVLNTHDSGVGHLELAPEPLCSDELGRCRAMLAYLPPRYGAPEAAETSWPVLFMHDGQNVFDDHDCCFGHTGWEVNVALDAEIAAGRVAPAVVVAVEHGGDARGDEYAFPEALGGQQGAFLRFQVEVAQVEAARVWRIDPGRAAVAGSSFGGLVSLRLVFEYPEVYRAAASLSGAFWPGEDTGHNIRDVIAEGGFLPLPLWLDHGGTAADGEDGYAGNVQVRDLLVATGWSPEVGPDCSREPGVLCYLHVPGATHDELAWRDRAPLFLRFLLDV